MHTIITRYMRTNSTLGDWTLETAPAYTSTLPKALDAINLPGKAWGDTSTLKIPPRLHSDSHECFFVLVSDRHHLRLCLIDRTSLMGLLSAVATRCTPARWCIQRIHRRRAPSCTSSCSRITDNLMSSSSGLRLLSLLSSFLPWPGARSRPRASSYLQWQRELHDLQWQRELFAVHSQVIARAAPVRP